MVVVLVVVVVVVAAAAAAPVVVVAVVIVVAAAIVVVEVVVYRSGRVCSCSSNYIVGNSGPSSISSTLLHQPFFINPSSSTLLQLLAVILNSRLKCFNFTAVCFSL